MSNSRRINLDLSPQKRALLDILLQKEGLSSQGVRRIPRREQSGPAVLSFGQQRLWLINELQPGNPVYNEHFTVRLSGVLNPSAVERAIGEIIRRHEVLRTVFDSLDEGPVQVIAPTLSIELPVVDLKSCLGDNRDAEALSLAVEESRRPFDLVRGPLLRATLLRLSDTEHWLMITVHHIVCDGWSFGVFIQELVTLYEAFMLEKRPPLAELPIQYADFAQWHRQWVEQDALATQLPYWKAKLAGLPPSLDFPFSRLRPAIMSFRGARQPIGVSVGVSESLKSLSRQWGATPFILLLSAFKALLFRYTGQQDIVIGTPVAGRNRVEIEALIGCFTNTLPLRTKVSGDRSFRDLVHEVREVAFEAYAHQDVPFEKLVEHLQMERDLSRTPLFQVMFALQNAPIPDVEFLGLSFDLVEVDKGTAKFDLMLELFDRPGGIEGWLEYNAELFDEDTIARIAQSFQMLITGIVETPELPVSHLPLLSLEEKHRLLVELNNTQADYPQEKLIHELFEAQVEIQPDAIALEYEAERLSYEELNRRANQVGWLLQALGVRPEARVGICTRRSTEMVVGMLGILKAGGAYVPLDAGYPDERLDFMLEDAQVQILVTQQHLVDGLVERFVRRGGNVMYLGSTPDACTSHSLDNPVSSANADNLAYVIFTSGSTGRPKGVALQHRSAVALLDWARHLFTPDELAGVLASTSVSFDLSVFELFAPLSSGGRIILVNDIFDVARLPVANHIKLINTVPSALGELLRDVDAPNSATTINLAGEALHNRVVRQAYELPGIERVFNLYGPSECTTYSTFALMKKASALAPTIGRPISNTQVYLLDAGFQVVPVGVIGEVYIAGEGLARGYLNRADLTAERFLPNPFGKPGTRIYRTGDLARYTPDGEIHFIGRKDHQVKLRGYRIELEEIEAVLRQRTSVQQAAVIVADDATQGKRLIAYVVAERSDPGTIGELRSFLKEKLPGYMVPSVFMMVDALPLTTSGKVDRGALPAPSISRAEVRQPYAAPITPTEELLSAIWAKLLATDHVGIHDNFFELGGHSLLATQLVSKVRKTFQVEIALQSFFEAPTITGLTTLIEKAKTTRSKPAPSKIKAIPREDHLAEAPAQDLLPVPTLSKN
jgi:amino acid adenylation domain-containing protein